MDGGRRVLRSLREPLSALFSFAHARPLPAGGAAFDFSASRPSSSIRPGAPLRRARGPESPRARLLALAASRGAGLLLGALFFSAVGLAGALQGGAYARFTAENGAPGNILARALGFSIAAVTITGQNELRESELLSASGVKAADSLVFLDAEAVRKRLTKNPLVESARVLKLYPNRLVIAIEERQPFALWQRDGRVSVVSADGAVIDEMRDERYAGLPFVVGEGAGARLDEYGRLLAAAGDLKQRIKAGILVAGRRWTLNLTNGVAVKLPEQGAEGALATLLKLQRESRLLDKDILSVDLRVPGRVAVRLTEEGAAGRAAALQRKSQKGGQT